MQNIPSNNKRVMKQSQKPRKKPLPHHSKMSSQVIESGDKGSNYSPLGSYTLMRYLVGNVAEVHTSTHVSIGVIKAISPTGDVGLMSVRTAPIESEDGPYTIEKHKCIPLSEIKHLVARDIKPASVLKDNITAEDSSHLNDSDGELQKFYESPGEGDACSLNSEEGFPVDQMFKINREKYNVVSTYKENLEGYTCPLDKSDPDFKKKEQYYSKIAKEIEDGKNLASNWEAMAEGDVESEEVKFSAVMKEGVQGRELKNTFNRSNRNNKGNRGNTRASLPRETTESNKLSVRPNAFTLPREQSKSVPETALSKSEKPTPKASRVTTPAICETPDKSETKENCENKSPSKLDFDPDAPVFEPSRTVPAESAGESPVTSSVTGSVQPQGVVSNPTFTQSQQALPNGVPSTPSFSTLPYPNPGLLSFPFRPSANMNPQQMTFMNQYPFLNAGTQNQRGIRPNAPGGYSKQRPLDQTNSVPLSLPFPGFGYPPYTLSVPFMAPGNVPLGHPSLAMAGSMPVAPTVQQSTSAQPLTAATAGQASQTVQSPPPVHAGTAQFQALFNPTQNPASYGTQYPTAAGGQPVGYYPQSLTGYQAAAGLMYHPGHPQAHGHGGQQPLIPQPLQMQANPAAPTPQQGAAAAAAYNHYQAAAVAAMASLISQQQQQQNAPPTAAFMHPQLQQLQYIAQQQQTNNNG
ncbi:unnamed protein product [Rodentolepis nana]|uniref:LsmAD domain-containing protein n=1 Tax=Rodentolepis nana TaxID=102285 RepID=A0A0R3TKA7_RODNA|nr:unnamed protein product [Rodentolepis nana]